MAGSRPEISEPQNSVAGLDLLLDRAGGRVRDSVMDAIREAIRTAMGRMG